MSGLFSSVKKTKAPAFTAPPVTDDTEAVKEAALRESERLRKRKGFASTIVTGPTGVSGNAPGTRNTLG